MLRERVRRVTEQTTRRVCARIVYKRLACVGCHRVCDAVVSLCAPWRRGQPQQQAALAKPFLFLRVLFLRVLVVVVVVGRGKRV